MVKTNGNKKDIAAEENGLDEFEWKKAKYQGQDKLKFMNNQIKDERTMVLIAIADFENCCKNRNLKRVPRRHLATITPPEFPKFMITCVFSKQY